MRRVFVAVLLLLLAAPAFGLSDTEYLRMRRNNADFADANKRLSQVWTRLKRSLPKRVFTELQKEQREWIASGRDDDAERYMDEGYSRVEAYTMATEDRADALPGIAQSLRRGTSRKPTERPAPTQPRRPSRRPDPEPEPEPEPEPQPEPTPEPEPTPAPAPEPEASQTPINPEGEYKSQHGFMTVKIIDRSSMEAEVVISRYKDEVHWKATGWIDDNVLELSDSQYSTCQATITFTAKGATITVTESGDWAKVTAEDFVIAGTYTKN